MSLFWAYTMVLGIVIQPFMGVLVEKHNKAKIMCFSDSIYAISDIGIGLLFFMRIPQSGILAYLYLNGTINTLMNALCEPASGALLPLIVEEKKLVKAYSIFSVCNNFINILGIAFASIVYSVIPFKWILIINGCLIGASAMGEWFIRVDEKNKEKESEQSYTKDLIEGIKYLFNKKILLRVTLCAIIINIFMSGIFSTSIPFLINTELNLPAYFLGFVQIALSVGSIISACVLTKKEVKQTGVAIFWGFVGVTISFIGMCIVLSIYSMETMPTMLFGILFGCIALMIGGISVLIQIPINLMYVKNVESEYMARIMAIRKTFSTVSVPIAMVVYGIMLDYINTNMVFWLSGVAMLFSLIYIRKLNYL